MLAPWKESYDKPRQCIKKQRHYFADKGLYRQNHGFSSSHVWMRELDIKEGWESNNWCFWIVMKEKMLERPLDYKETKPINLKTKRPWIFIRRTDAVAEALILWPSDTKRWLFCKDPDAVKDWKQKEKMAEDQMVRQHHWFNGHEF